MNSSAHVKSIEGLGELKNAVAAFGEVAQDSVSQVAQEVTRVLRWLAEREHYWQQQVRLAQEMVRHASADLRACESSHDEDSDCSAERAALARAHAHLRETEGELQKVQRYRQKIEQNFDAFTHEASRFANQSLSSILTYLGRAVAKLESYLADAPPGDSNADATIATNGSYAKFGSSNDAGNALYQRELGDQIERAAAALSQMAEIAPSCWNTSSLAQRVEALTNIEHTMAAIQNRPAVPVKTSKNLYSEVLGQYDQDMNMITLNENRLASNQDDVFEHVGTIVHEGRHAYQHYATQNPRIMPDPKMVAAWANNMQPGNYFSPSPKYNSKGEKYYDPQDYQKYAEQPVEADAFAYEDTIIGAIKSSFPS